MKMCTLIARNHRPKWTLTVSKEKVRGVLLENVVVEIPKVLSEI